LVAVRIGFQGTRKGFVVCQRVWARSDERHLAFQHVEQLWQLVEAGAAQKAADFGDAIVASDSLADGGTVFHNGHGAKFEDFDGCLIAASAALAEQHRALALAFDGERNQRPERRADDENDCAENDIFKALGDGRPID